MTDLQRSHAELRAAVLLAGKEIRKLDLGERIARFLRFSGLRKSREAARKEGLTMRVWLELLKQRESIGGGNAVR
jgi:hypothetical protein